MALSLDNNKKWNISLKEIQDTKGYEKIDKRWRSGWQNHLQRTHMHEVFDRVAHNLSLFHKKRKDMWSEGSTQRALRKMLTQSLQRIPDGDLIDQWDEHSIERAEEQFLWDDIIVGYNEPGRDMLKTLTRAFKQSQIYGFAAVRTEFVENWRNDIIPRYKLLRDRDIIPDPDCDYIEECEWCIAREWVSKSVLEGLLDSEGHITDSTYNEDVVKYMIEQEVKSGVWIDSIKLADKEKGWAPIESCEIRTLYRKGDREFVTWVPSLSCVLRTVPNYDPWLDIPVHFLVLDPDPAFPYGVSSVFWTMTQQQFLDAVHSVSGQTLLLAFEPPLLVPQNLTEENFEMTPNAIWNMGTNPNMKIEKFPVETSTLLQRNSIMEAESARMLAMLNITDATVARDAGVPNYSNTPQGVELQREDRTITVNQFMKRIEVFFAELTSHAFRSYLNSMGGVQEVTVNEVTRRKIQDVERSLQDDDPTYVSIINGTKVAIDFSALKADSFFFDVRKGSTVEERREQQLAALSKLYGPLPQSLQALRDTPYQDVITNVMVQIIQQMADLSGTDISASTSTDIQDIIARQALQATMEEVMSMQQQIAAMQQQQLPQASESSQALVAASPEQQGQEPPQYEEGMPFTIQ